VEYRDGKVVVQHGSYSVLVPQLEQVAMRRRGRNDDGQLTEDCKSKGGAATSQAAVPKTIQNTLEIWSKPKVHEEAEPDISQRNNRQW
jgi:hypothetical protein